jgi:hypothetical protein
MNLLSSWDDRGKGHVYNCNRCCRSSNFVSTHVALHQKTNPEKIMKIHLSRHIIWPSIALLMTGMLLTACGGGGSEPQVTPPVVTPPAVALPVLTGSLPGIVEGTIVGTASGTSTGVVSGTSNGVAQGTINGTSMGAINGTVTGTVTQSVSGAVTSAAVVNAPTNLPSATVTGVVVGAVNGMVNGTVTGTVVGNVTGTIVGAVQGTASGTVTAVPVVSAAPASAIAKSYLQAIDASRVSFNASGTETFTLLDGCYLDQGNSKPFLIADWNSRTDQQARRAFDVGSTRANTAISVLADRSATNPDGTTRRELDIQFSVIYTDGTRNMTATSTIISGSSAGSRNADGTACATPENKAAWRAYGNRQIVDFSMIAINEDVGRSNLSDGSAKTPSVWFNNYIDLRMRDPANVATYYTISGPGLNSGGNTATFIAVSPRLLRSDPLFAGKVGNNVDWRDTDSFRFCRVSPTSGNFAPAATANCPTNGASGSSYGTFSNTTEAAADTAFNALGFVVGGVYDIKVYSGNGWQTVNGFASATPMATFTHTLTSLPYSAAALRPASGLLFPDLNGTVTSVVAGTNTSAKIAQSIRDKSAFTADLSWQTTPVLPDGTRAGLGDLSYFVTGPIPGGAAGSWPRSRQNNNYFPAPNSRSFALNQAALNSNIGTPNFGQIALTFTNRNGNGVVSFGTWD